MLQKIGYLNKVCWEELFEFLHSMSWRERLNRFWTNHIYEIQMVEVQRNTSSPKIKLHETDDLLCPGNKINNDEDLFKNDEEIRQNVQRGISHYNSLDIPINIVFEDELIATFFYADNRAISLPKEYLDISYAADFNHLNYSQIKTLMSKKLPVSNVQEIVVYTENQTVTDAKTKLEEANSRLEIAKKEAEKELEEFRKQMYLKEKELLALHEKKLAELEELKNNLEDQIFLLEMNIFALRSFFGETYSLVHINKGKNAPEEQVLTIYQKFRYLDEEFARFAGISTFDTKNYDAISVFKENPELVETFCPNDKCITFFKVSKDNVLYSYSRTDDCLEMYKYFHGNQIGMLIRNGENLFLSFIDEEVTLKDNLFVTEVSANQEKAVEIGVTKIRDKDARPMVNRKLIFIILQQIVSNTNIFFELRNENIFQSSKILMSAADNQLVKFKYPSFKECYDKFKDVKLEDEVFVLERHAGSRVTNANAWGSYREEHRGSGYRNTGRDADIETGIYKVNLLQDNHIFVSCKREIYDEEWYRSHYGVSKINNTNLRVYNDEYMSIVWINSNYPVFWIDSKHIGHWYQINYTYLIPKLRIMLKHLLNREAEEWTLLYPFVKEIGYTPELKDKVLEWRIANNVRKLTPFQVKRFVKWYSGN